VGDLEQQRRLAHARLAGHQQHRPGHQPAAETRSNSSMPVGTARAAASSTWAMGTAGAVTGPAATAPQRGGRGADLLDGAPGLALGAPADPLGGGVAALGAAVGGAGPHSGRWHAPTLAAGVTLPGRSGSVPLAGARRRRRSRSRGRCPRRPRTPLALLVVEVEGLLAGDHAVRRGDQRLDGDLTGALEGQGEPRCSARGELLGQVGQLDRRATGAAEEDRGARGDGISTSELAVGVDGAAGTVGVGRRRATASPREPSSAARSPAWSGRPGRWWPPARPTGSRGRRGRRWPARRPARRRRPRPRCRPACRLGAGVDDRHLQLGVSPSSYSPSWGCAR
jgi:hypothetical protein